jgi:cleavage and polyadenylation specificity factor subunit 1
MLFLLSSRIKAKKDTVCLAVVSMDLGKRKFPLLYSVKDLPYNSTKIVPVPKPVGGILIFSTNILIHVDQSSLPGNGVGVNKFSKLASDFPHQELENKNISMVLDNCHCVFLDAHTLLLCLQRGELFLVDIVLEGRSVSEFRIDQVGTSVIPSCATRVMQNYIFLGSKMGDSVVIKFTESESDVTKVFLMLLVTCLYSSNLNVEKEHTHFNDARYRSW